MPTPQSLLDAEAEADKLIAQLAGEGTPQPEDGEADPPKPEAKTPADGDSEPGDEGAAPLEQDPPPPGDTPSTEEKLAELQAKFDKLTAQHDTLRGKTYAEVPRVLAENRTLLARISELESALAAKETDAKASKSAKATDLLGRIKEKVDDDVVDQINELIATTVEERLADRVGKVEGSIENLKKTAAELAEEKYIAKLTELVPEWREIVVTDEYANFLATEDELSGRTLHSLAIDAMNRKDAVTQSKFYKRYLASQSADTTKSGSTTPPAKAGAQAPKGKEALIAPKSGSAGSREEGEKPDYITGAELERLRKARKNMTEAEEAALDARIDRAIQNRWIVP